MRHFFELAVPRFLRFSCGFSPLSPQEIIDMAQAFRRCGKAWKISRSGVPLQEKAGYPEGLVRCY